MLRKVSLSVLFFVSLILISACNGGSDKGTGSTAGVSKVVPPSLENFPEESEAEEVRTPEVPAEYSGMGGIETFGYPAAYSEEGVQGVSSRDLNYSVYQVKQGDMIDFIAKDFGIDVMEWRVIEEYLKRYDNKFPRVITREVLSLYFDYNDNDCIPINPKRKRVGDGFHSY